MRDAKQAAEAALDIDDSFSDGYGALGYYYSCLEVNWVESRKNFLKANELNPKYVQARSVYGLHYLAWGEGNFEEAEEQGRMTIRLEPLSAIDHADLAWTLYTEKRFEEALALAKTGIELDANSFLSHRLCGLCYTALGQHKEAIDTLTHLLTISSRYQHALTALIWAHCSNSNFDEARKLMVELEGRSSSEYIAGTYAGFSAVFLGDLDKAFDYLEKAYDDHDPMLTKLKYLPYVPESLKEKSRFWNLLARIGYPE